MSNEYDYVIVGAGAAGCVLAARLSEDPGVSVALVEAGPSDTAEAFTAGEITAGEITAGSITAGAIKVPAAFPSLFKTRVDWDYDSEPEPGLGHRRAYLPRGRTLGGSTAINAMVYMRGNALDYDEWAELGATGWDYASVLPYFKRAEDNERGADDYHGVGGPLHVSDPVSPALVAELYVRAAVEAGHPSTADFNGPSQDGVGLHQLMQHRGLRWSAADGYLRPALGRANLSVLTEATVTRLVLRQGRAVGVQVSRAGGGAEVLRAAREVLLCAGAYNSPKVLLLSGIGPADELAAFGIPVVADLPVGHGLRDHVLSALNYRTTVESLTSAATAENQAALAEGRGPLTSNIDEGGGFLRTRSGLAGPDVQLHAGPVMFLDDGLGVPREHGMVLAVSVLHQHGGGQVSLRSADPFAAPRIRHNYLRAPEDIASLVAGLRIARKIAAQPALRPVLAGAFEGPDSDSDVDLLGYARRTAQTQYHPACTCPIGPVVDTELRVHGVEGLRVVDTSVMPTIVRGNTAAPTMMIAERAADLIRGVVTS